MTNLQHPPFWRYSSTYVWLFVKNKGGASAYQLGVSSAVQNEVFGFQVSVNDAFGVQVGERFDHAARVEPGGGIFKGAPETEFKELWRCSQHVLSLCDDSLTSFKGCNVHVSYLGFSQYKVRHDPSVWGDIIRSFVSCFTNDGFIDFVLN